MTYSFFCKSNLTGTFTICFSDSDNTRQFSTSYSLASANTWEKIVINIPADTTGAFTNDNGVSFIIQMNLQAGTDKQSGALTTAFESSTAGDRAVGQTNFFSSTSNNWYITGCQLEIGDAATDFEHLPFDVQFHRCQRYFQKITHRYRIVTRWNNNSGVPIGYMDFMQTMNHEPTVTNSGTYEDGTGYGQTPSYGGTTENGTYIAGAVSVSTNNTNYIHNGVSEMDAEL